MYRPNHQFTSRGAQPDEVVRETSVSTALTGEGQSLTGNIRETLADVLTKLEHGNRIALRWHCQMVRAMHAWFEVLIGGSWIVPHVPPLLGCSRAARLDLLILNHLPDFTDQ